MSGDTFVCAACGGEFELCTDPAEVEAEFDALFPGMRGQPREVVCDVCFKQMTTELPPAEWMKQQGSA